MRSVTLLSSSSEDIQDIQDTDAETMSISEQHYCAPRILRESLDEEHLLNKAESTNSIVSSMYWNRLNKSYQCQASWIVGLFLIHLGLLGGLLGLHVDLALVHLVVWMTWVPFLVSFSLVVLSCLTFRPVYTVSFLTCMYTCVLILYIFSPHIWISALVMSSLSLVLYLVLLFLPSFKLSNLVLYSIFHAVLGQKVNVFVFLCLACIFSSINFIYCLLLLSNRESRVKLVLLSISWFLTNVTIQGVMHAYCAGMIAVWYFNSSPRSKCLGFGLLYRCAVLMLGRFIFLSVFLIPLELYEMVVLLCHKEYSNNSMSLCFPVNTYVFTPMVIYASKPAKAAAYAVGLLYGKGFNSLQRFLQVNVIFLPLGMIVGSATSIVFIWNRIIHDSWFLLVCAGCSGLASSFFIFTALQLWVNDFLYLWAEDGSMLPKKHPDVYAAISNATQEHVPILDYYL